MMNLNLNRISQAFSDSAMGNLKQRILEQELTFRNQVRELHHLYWTQRNLMKDFRENGLNGEIGNSFYGRSFDLQLPADDFINIELNNRGLETDRLKVNGKFDAEKRLVFSVGSGCKKIIDLEDSVDLDRQENDACCVPSIVHFGEEKDGNLKEQMDNPSCAGIDDSSLDSVTDHSRITHESWTVTFDLNMPLEDSEVHRISQDSMLAGNYTMNYNDIESSKLNINVLLSAYPVEGSIGSIDGALISINEKGEVFPPNKLPLVPITDNNWQSSNTSKNSMNLLQTLSIDSEQKERNHEKSGTFSAQSAADECTSYEKSVQEPATLSLTDDSVITNSNEISYFDKLNSEEQDIATKSAAQTLIAISFGKPDFSPKKFDVTEVTKMPLEEHIQVSSESFEAMTMNLTEIQNEEIIPDIPRLNAREKDEMRIRPKRGKRIRNFQKEILPGLVSLSRHEICEDLYSINYKFRRNGFGAKGNFFVPVTSRRSRRCAGRRRRRSFYDQC